MLSEEERSKLRIWSAFEEAKYELDMDYDDFDEIMVTACSVGDEYGYEAAKEWVTDLFKSYVGLQQWTEKIEKEMAARDTNERVKLELAKRNYLDKIKSMGRMPPSTMGRLRQVEERQAAISMRWRPF